MKTLTIFLFLMLLVRPLLGVESPVVTANGDAYLMDRSKNENNELVFELRRISPDGTVTVLWRSLAQTHKQVDISKPQPLPLSLSPIAAVCDEQNEISLLILDDESDALVFRFAVSATTATPIRIRGLRRARDPHWEMRFKRHGELMYVSPDLSQEKLIRFDNQGNITADFRGVSNAGYTIIIKNGEEFKPPLTRSEAPSQVSEPSSQRSPAQKMPEAKPLTATFKLTSSTLWSVVAVLILAAIGLLWLVLNKRK